MKDQEILNIVFSHLPQAKINSIIVYPNESNGENLCVILNKEGITFQVPSAEFKRSHLGQISFMSLRDIGRIWERNDSFVNNLEKGRGIYNSSEKVQ